MLPLKRYMHLIPLEGYLGNSNSVYLQEKELG